MSENPSRPSGLSRRELLGAAVSLPLWRAFSHGALAQGRGLETIRKSRGLVVGAGDADVSKVELSRDWAGAICRSRVTNRGTSAVAIKEIVLFDFALDLPPSTSLYAESFQMLSQSDGTLGAPKDLGSYTDAKHYKIPMPAGTQTYFGAMTLFPPAADSPASPKPRSGEGWALAFTSTRRFAGLFRLRPPTPALRGVEGSLQVIVDTEGLTLAPGQSWDLEEFSIASGKNRDAVLGTVGTRLAANHPPHKSPAPPTGWCSWYCFGPRVTAKQVLDNLDLISTKIPGLTYVQIDDGYQPAMGDWLETGAAFGGDVRKVLDEIRKKGFQPAIWVAPFVAEEGSHVFQQHRDWFVQDTDGSPLRSDKVTFGGWRKGPWYVLLKKMLPPTGVSAVFDDENLRVGTVTLPGRRMVCLFNWTDAPMTLSARLTRASTVTDFWSGASLGRKDVVTIADMLAHSARLLECRDV